jgi:hypothetical protein
LDLVNQTSDRIVVVGPTLIFGQVSTIERPRRGFVVFVLEGRQKARGTNKGLFFFYLSTDFFDKHVATWSPRHKNN